jgi:hypothetical protein
MSFLGENDKKSGSSLIRGARLQTSLLDGLAYDPEPLGAAVKLSRSLLIENIQLTRFGIWEEQNWQLEK